MVYEFCRRFILKFVLFDLISFQRFRDVILFWSFYTVLAVLILLWQSSRQLKFVYMYINFAWLLVMRNKLLLFLLNRVSGSSGVCWLIRT